MNVTSAKESKKERLAREKAESKAKKRQEELDRKAEEERLVKEAADREAAEVAAKEAERQKIEAERLRIEAEREAERKEAERQAMIAVKLAPLKALYEVVELDPTSMLELVKPLVEAVHDKIDKQIKDGEVELVVDPTSE